MAAKDKTLWKMEPQTLGKHLVLRKYLDAWLPIRGSSHKRILFIDGFAGPGEYVSGEDGSPIIALKAHIEHAYKQVIGAEVRYIFIEEDVSRAARLQGLVNKLRPQFPHNCKVEEVVVGRFDEKMTDTLNALDQQAATMAPAFVMVDPFGVSDTPMGVIERILRNPRSEVYISFMYDWVNRFIGTPEFEAHLDKLFGCHQWRDVIGVSESDERKEYLHGLYEDQLRRSGGEYVLRFELFRERRHIYTLFFATKNLTGCDKMKAAMWRVAPAEGVCFYGTKSAQLTLGVDQPNFRPLRGQLLTQFSGKGWVGIQEVLDFVASDKTDYHTGQVKKPVLVPMEANGELEVDETSRKRKNSFPEGTRLRFLAGP